MNIGIVGSRNFTDYAQMEDAMNSFMSEESHWEEDCSIVSGGAEGADTLSEQLAMSWDMASIIMKPQWSLYGKAAGFVRNGLIVQESDYIMVFFGPPEHKKEFPSKGASNTLQIARERGVPYEVHYQSWKGNQ
jgi:hypothetical protein